MEVVCKENSRTSTGHRKEILVLLKDACAEFILSWSLFRYRIP